MGAVGGGAAHVDGLLDTGGAARVEEVARAVEADRSHPPVVPRRGYHKREVDRRIDALCLEHLLEGGGDVALIEAQFRGGIARRAEVEANDGLNVVPRGEPGGEPRTQISRRAGDGDPAHDAILRGSGAGEKRGREGAHLIDTPSVRGLDFTSTVQAAGGAPAGMGGGLCMSGPYTPNSQRRGPP